MEIATLEQLIHANSRGNRSTSCKMDVAQYGLVEHWGYPVSGAGACEDVALWKRKLLVDMGCDPTTLNFATCKDQDGKPHVVLAAELLDATYVLDNRDDEVKPINQVPYEWDQITVGGDLSVWTQVSA